MKNYFLLLISLFTLLTSTNAQFGQECDIEVQAIISPSSRVTYNTVDTFDIIVRIKNNGPSRLIAGDEFVVNYSVGDGTSNTVSIDTLLLVGSNRTMEIGEARNYTLAKDFILIGNNIFSACASVSGTTMFPTNTNKFPGECERFVVSVKEQSIDINKVYFAQNRVIVKLNGVAAREVKIFDITGKLIKSSNKLKTKEISIPFTNQNKGFYFVTVTDQNGSQATAKFVVSQ